jgi:hypothetical protein
VLRARSDAPFLGSPNECSHVTRDELRLRAERSDADHRVLRIRVHVGHRSEVQRHPSRVQAVGHRSRHFPGELDVVDGTESQIPGIGAPGAGLEPRHVAPLLVDRHDQF